jgi:DNA modification methylase
VLDDHAAELLDEQTHTIHGAGAKCDGSDMKVKRSYNANAYHMGQHFPHRFGDSGGASRFFYTAKPSKRERGEFNSHPTVKSLSLLRYLCLLTKTPTGGVVLDPFMGSGTTGIACLETGRRFVGIEKEKDYFKIAKRRIQEKIKS